MSQPIEENLLANYLAARHGKPAGKEPFKLGRSA
jgi:hypothetical protein